MSPNSSTPNPSSETGSHIPRNIEVRFFKHDEAFGCFANFSLHPITVGERTWPTVEHFFQAQKFTGTDPDAVEAIAIAPTPKDAAAIGRDRTRPLRTDWESVKDDLMRVGVISKLLAHPEIREMLLGTGDAEIIEASPKDSYWGCGADGNGKNMLGKIYMEARSLFRPGSSEKPEEYLKRLRAKTNA